ncbi:MAG: diaminopimelate decarboxylase [Rhodospirillaceae bacterium]|nr:diaminopimelate decarboxylase [Rhodospirillaceae bacterium]
MSTFDYQNGRLHAESVCLSDLADQVDTPFYCYSASALEHRYRRLAEAISASGTTIAYAVKANSNLAVVSLLGGLGSGADVVSEGELRRAMAAGIPADRILFSGVGKSVDELAFAIGEGIHQINIESETEFDRVLDLAQRAVRTVRIALRINPGIEAGGHDKISTGRKTDKFGISAGHALELYRRAEKHAFVEPVGLAMHIGSQISDVSAFAGAFDYLAEATDDMRRKGLTVSRLDLGGGLGVAYHDDEQELPLEDYGALLKSLALRTDAQLTIEPGRWLVAGAGVLVTRVNAIKQAGDRRFVIVDAAMNDLIRPTLYDAHHPVWPVDNHEDAALHPSTVAGPVCESGDILAFDAPLPGLAAGDLVTVGHAGAYGAVMSSGYNGRLLVPEVLVRGDDFAVVRRRPSHDEAMALESIPEWSSATAAA